MDATGRFETGRVQFAGHTIAFLATCVAICAALLSAGCSGGGDKRELRPPTLHTLIIHGPRLIGGVEQNWSVQLSQPDHVFGGYSGSFLAPFTVSWDFGGGAEPNTYTVEQVDMGGMAGVRPTMLNDSANDPASYVAKVTITDIQGLVSTTVKEYTVGTAYVPLQLLQANYDINTSKLTVEASADPRALPVEITLALPGGMLADRTVSSAGGNPATAEFNLSAVDYFSGTTGQVEITLTDGLGFTSKEHIYVSVANKVMDGDTLLVLPESNMADVHETVTVVVATSQLPYPFHHPEDVCVTFPDWVHYVPYSLNPGMPGNFSTEPDGVWGPYGVNADSVLISANQDVVETPVPGSVGRHYIACQVLPLDGHGSTALSGGMFNFKVYFDKPGQASLGLLPPSTGVFDRTYYRDGAGEAHAWGTLMAAPDGALNIAGWDNTIVVTE